MIALSLHKQLKTYDGAQTLRVETSFPVNAITQIIGPSGAGKTTLLKMIAGLVQPDKGRIQMADEVWLDTQQKINLPPQKRTAGFVFQDYALFPNMTLQQHLQYGTNDAAYIERLLAIGRLEAFKKHKPVHLSGGQQQRLAILRALSTKPKLLLMDEPFSALDQALKEEMMKDIKALLNERKTTCLVVTHLPLNETGFADHTFLLK